MDRRLQELVDGSLVCRFQDHIDRLEAQRDYVIRKQDRVSTLLRNFKGTTSIIKDSRKELAISRNITRQAAKTHKKMHNICSSLRRASKVAQRYIEIMRSNSKET